MRISSAGRRTKRGAAIDWARVHERLARTAAGGAALEIGSEQAQAVLAERAQALAAPLASEAVTVAGLSVVLATIAAERYAIETALVWRVMRMPLLTRIPGAPEIVLGVINLNGEVLPVFDPRRLLRLGGAAPTAHGPILVLGTQRADFGLTVDAVHEVTTVLTEQLLTGPDSMEPAARSILRGVRADGVIVFDGAKLMTDSRLRIARTEPA